MVFLLILSIVSLSLLIGAGVLFARARRRATTGIEITATVVSFSHYVSNGRPMYSPIFSAMAEGRKVSGSTLVAKSWKSPPLGSNVKVRYDPSNPDAPLVISSILEYLVPLILLGVGLVLGYVVIVIGLKILADSDSPSASNLVRAPSEVPSSSAAGATMTTPLGAAVPAAVNASNEALTGIQNVFRSQSRSTKTCYEQHLRHSKNQPLAGEVRIKLTISPEGQALGVAVESSTIVAPDVESCLVKQVSSWIFPPAKQATPFAWTFRVGSAN